MHSVKNVHARSIVVNKMLAYFITIADIWDPVLPEVPPLNTMSQIREAICHY